MHPRPESSSLLPRQAAALLALLAAGCTVSAPSESTPQHPQSPSAPTSRSRADEATTQCADFNPYKNVYWGDLHTHTAYSVDAYSFRTRATPQEAYAFARGASVKIAAGDTTGESGPTTQLPAGRLLDFNAVTDHAEWLPTGYGCGAGEDGGAYSTTSPYYNSDPCLRYRSPDLTSLGGFLAHRQICGVSTAGTLACASELRSAWQATQQAAEQAYVPCQFTTFNGYEWTYTPNYNTLHRNVIFANEVVPRIPYSSLDYTDPVALWTALDQGCQNDAGCRALTIPHNPNESNGLAFDLPGDGGPEVIAQMVRYQRLAEIIQHKGGSECFYDPDAGYTDPLCQFELVTQGGAYVPLSYLRQGLERGLQLQEDGGTNPLALGFVGATDNHNATPGAVLEGFWSGHVGIEDNTPEERLQGNLVEYNPGGLTGVWAEQNTRASIFAALERREVFATSGPRIKVRFYQTWSNTDFCSGALPGGGSAPFPNNIIDSGGVPMGGTMGSNPGSGNPYFIVSAAKDLADLAEIDIIKADVVGGQIRERVHRFTLPGSQGYSTAAPCLIWEDTEYQPGAPAFYYARVLQVPTPRWTSYDCDRLGAQAPAGCEPGGALRQPIQERAWSSPVWAR